MEKIDMNSITKSVQEQITKIRQSGGNKKAIDTQSEYEQLQQMLSGGNLKKAETIYVQGLMVEYENSVKDANISDNARNSMKSIKKVMPDKKELNEAEARMVLDLINNTNGEWNQTEIEYFKQELIQAGYENLLEEMQNGYTNSDENQIALPEKTIENKPADKTVPDEPIPYETVPADPPVGKELSTDNKPPFMPERPMPNPPFFKKPPIDEEPPVGAKPPLEDELPEELPTTDEADEPAHLTNEQKAEAQNAGKKIAEYLDGYTMDIEQAHVVDYTKKELNSENIIEFMKGYAKGGADPFFKQLLSEYNFPEKYDVARDVAQKMRDYIENKGISEKNCKIIDGILAKDEFSESDIAELDKITQSLTEIPVK